MHNSPADKSEKKHVVVALEVGFPSAETERSSVMCLFLWEIVNMYFSQFSIYIL